MNELSLFTGAGGGVYASKLLGHRIVGYVECDDYCQRVIRQRVRDGIFDDAPIFADVRTFDGRPYRGKVDLVSAGVPCQWISVAGKREDPSTERNLWPDTLRIVGEVRPRFAFFENPPNLATHSYFGTILENLEAIGYELPRPPAIIGADDLGGWHERKRAWILAADSHRKQLWQQPGRPKSRSEATQFAVYGEEGTAADANRVRQLQSKGREQNKRGRTSDGGWWSSEPGVVRVVHGLANRVDRERALGNGQVPIVAATAFALLAGAAGRGGR